MCWCVVSFWVYLFLFLLLLLKSKIMLCVNYWWIWFVFDGKTKWKEKMVKIPVEVGETFNAYLNLIFFELLLVVGSWFEESFTVDVSEPKPNKPNTMNLVKKWTQELGLSEDSVKGLARSLGSGIIKGVEERQKSILGLSPRMNSSSPQFSDASWPNLSGVLRTIIAPLSCEIFVVIYPSAPFILTVYLLIMQVATWVPLSFNAFLNLMWVAADMATLFRGHSFINAARLPAAGI